LFLTGLTHRDRLFEVSRRWLLDRLDPEDGRFVTQVFLFEDLISAPTARGFARDILGSVWPGPHERRHLLSKDAVREAILCACREPNQREAALFEQFCSHPEEFFPRTPVDLVLTTSSDGHLIGMTRLKRIRRIADKVSRRVADLLAGEIRAEARALARSRAEKAGMALEALVSPRAVMDEEFATAERLVAQSFKEGSLDLEPAGLRVDDVIGSKYIGTSEELERVEAAIRAHPAATVFQREVHQGIYNDVNLLVDLALPPVGEIIDRVRLRDWSDAAQRGLDRTTLDNEFAHYVESGARTVRTEVILTTFTDLVESEFGRSMHEQRILTQRFTASYSGRIAQNASYIIEYLLNVAISPTVEVKAIPVKMWGRYLPDTLSVAISRLFRQAPADRLFDTFSPPPAAVSEASGTESRLDPAAVR
jgi:hypothetical protein